MLSRRTAFIMVSLGVLSLASCKYDAAKTEVSRTTARPANQKIQVIDPRKLGLTDTPPPFPYVLDNTCWVIVCADGYNGASNLHSCRDALILGRILQGKSASVAILNIGVDERQSIFLTEDPAPSSNPPAPAGTTTNPVARRPLVMEGIVEEEKSGPKAAHHSVNTEGELQSLIQKTIEADCSGKDVYVMYSGHGVEGPDGTMVIPNPQDAADRDKDMDIGGVVSVLPEKLNVKLLITDACQGPANCTIPTVSSSAAGETAADEGDGGKSPFVGALVELYRSESKAAFEAEKQDFNKNVNDRVKPGQPTQTPTVVPGAP